MKPNPSCIHAKELLRFLLILALSFQATNSSLAAGVTIITHGFGSMGGGGWSMLYRAIGLAGDIHAPTC